MSLVYSIWCDQLSCNRYIDFTPKPDVTVCSAHRAIRYCDWSREGEGDEKERHYCPKCSADRAAQRE